MHYYQHHIGDFIKDTSNLDDHQMVTYMRMMWAYYGDEKPFADDCEGIAFAVRSDEKTVSLILRHYFVLEEAEWHHRRCDREISEYKAKAEKARNSANARWKNANALRPDSNRNAKATKNDANQEPITKNQEPQDQKTTAAVRRNWISELIGLGVSENHAADWMEVRKGRKAKMTDTVLDGIKREADKAGVTFGEAIRICAERSWQGFNASWLDKPGQQAGGFMTKQERIEEANQRVLREMNAAADAQLAMQGGTTSPKLDDQGFVIEGDFFREN